MAVSKQREALECYKVTANDPVSIKIVPEEPKDQEPKDSEVAEGQQKKKSKKKKA